MADRQSPSREGRRSESAGLLPGFWGTLFGFQLPDYGVELSFREDVLGDHWCGLVPEILEDSVFIGLILCAVQFSFLVEQLEAADVLRGVLIGGFKFVGDVGDAESLFDADLFIGRKDG